MLLPPAQAPQGQLRVLQFMFHPQFWDCQRCWSDADCKGQLLKVVSEEKKQVKPHCLWSPSSSWPNLLGAESYEAADCPGTVAQLPAGWNWSYSFQIPPAQRSTSSNLRATSSPEGFCLLVRKQIWVWLFILQCKNLSMSQKLTISRVFLIIVSWNH